MAKRLGLRNMQGHTTKATDTNSIIILFKKCTKELVNLNIEFEVITNLKNPTTATLRIFEPNQVISLNGIIGSFITLYNGKNTIKATLQNYQNTLNSNTQLQAQITCRNLKSNVITFNLECLFGNICERDLTVDEVKNIVKTLRENTDFKDKGKNYPLTQLPWYSIDKVFHRNNETGKFRDELVTNNSFENFTVQLNKIFQKYEINNCKRRAHFLAQCYVETENFTKTVESDNGYTSGYDPYRGRGLIHLTLLENYQKYQKDTKNTVVNKEDGNSKTIKSGRNDNTNCKIVATNLEIAADVAGWYWKYGSRKGDINIIADKGSVKEVTPYINAASLQLKERENAFNLLIKIFKK